MNLHRIYPQTILLIAFTLCALAPSLRAKNREFSFAEPIVVGVQFFAVWCPACKELDPKLDKALGKFIESPVLFTRFDVSNIATQYQSGQLARSLGLFDLYEEVGIKTGFVVLINRATGQEIDRIERGDTPKQIVSKIQEAIDKAAARNASASSQSKESVNAANES